MSKKRIKQLSDLGEFGLIKHFQESLSNDSKVVLGIGDDTAVIKKNAREYLLITSDMLQEGQHFSLEDDPVLVGRKALNVSISDIAAMGGLPEHAVVSIGVPKDTDLSYVKKIYRGLKLAAKRYEVNIVGGDTITSSKITINTTVLGEVEKKFLVTRSGAKSGDLVFVSGSLGQSYKSGHHLKFKPRVKEARDITKKYKPTAMIDISDGLSSDLNHILKASNLGAELEESSIPRRNKADLKSALNDGEDFELLFTLPRKRAQKLIGKKGYTCIGKTDKSIKGLKIKRVNGSLETVKPSGFAHF